MNLPITNKLGGKLCDINELMVVTCTDFLFNNEQYEMKAEEKNIFQLLNIAL